MKNLTSSFPKFFLFLIIALSILFADQVTLAQSNSDDQQLAVPDSVQALRREYRSKETWEHIVSLPGTLISLPFILFFKSQELLVKAIDVNKVIPRVKNIFISADGRRGVAPTYTGRSGYGLKFFQKDLISPGSRFTLTAMGTVHGRRNYRLWLQRVSLLNGIVFTDFLIRYRKLTGESFFGLGPQSQNEDRSNYDHERLISEAVLGLRPYPGLSLFTLFGYDHNEVFQGTDKDFPSTTQFFSEATLPGLESNTNLMKLELGVHFNSKNRVGNPSSGSEILFSGSIYKEVSDKKFDFWKVSGDWRQFVHLFHNRVLVLRVAGEVTEPFEGNEIPFYYLSTLGRFDTIRGFQRGRFYDRDYLIVSGEYRFPFWYGIDMLMFLDAGQVSQDIFSGFSFDKFKLGYGFGFRLYNSERMIMSLQLGFSDERFRLYFRLNSGSSRRNRFD